MKVLFPVDEAYPLFKIGGLGDVGGSLPIALNKLGIEVAVMLPKHPEVDDSGFEQVLDYQIGYNGADLTVRLLKGTLGTSPITTYLVAEDTYLSQKTDASDNHADKFAVFSLAVAHFLQHHTNEFRPDVVHCHDWHTALVPLITRKLYHNQDFRFMLTIHNLAYQGNTNTPVLDKMGMEPQFIEAAYGLTSDGHLNIMLQGIMESDLVVPVSPTYAQEILTPEYGEKLESHLHGLAHKIKGVLNGLDLHTFNPEIDANLFHQYSLNTVFETRPINKTQLLKQVGLNLKPEDFLIGFVGRVDGHQKGIELIVEWLQSDYFDQPNRGFVFLGTGESQLEEQLNLAGADRDNVRVFTRYDEELAIRIYAGADVMAIPSKFEPCGLVQMIAMRYGSVPIARRTGGLADTIVDGVDGYLFEEYSVESMVAALDRAQADFGQFTTWRNLITQGMSKDFSWDSSALTYQDLYTSMLHR